MVAQSEVDENEIRFEVKSALEDCNCFLNIPLFLKNGRKEVMRRRVQLVFGDCLLRPLAGFRPFARVCAFSRHETGNPGCLRDIRTAFEFSDSFGVMSLLE